MHVRIGIVMILLLGACATGASAPTGGIQGTVTQGPTCPVETPNSPCPPGIWTGTVRATAADGTISETQTDANGRFVLPLSAGTYTVVPVIAGSGPPTARSVTVNVGEGVMQTVDLQVDTGIR